MNTPIHSVLNFRSAPSYKLAKMLTGILKSYIPLPNVYNIQNFMLEREQDNTLNFLDLTIKKTTNKMSLDIYRKPTTSESIIPKDSCHPLEHKLATIRYFANRTNTYDLDHVKKQKQTP